MSGYFFKTPVRLFKRFRLNQAGIVLANGSNFPVMAQIYNVGGLSVNSTTYSAVVPMFTVPPGFIASITSVIQVTAMGGAVAGESLACLIQGGGTYQVYYLPAALPAGFVGTSRDVFVAQGTGAEITAVSPVIQYVGAGAPVIGLNHFVSLWSFV